MNQETVAKLKELEKAYQEAEEFDVVQSGKFQGMSPNNLVNEILHLIRGL